MGYYKVGNKTFAGKLEAVLEAQATKQKVEWNFFDEVFEKVNWFEEPTMTIDQLYKIRAQQIREKYDYVVVFASGGADSTNVVKSFINNGIKIDEIISLAPISGLNNWDFNNQDQREENTISEVKYALMPFLNEISQSNPEIKITINDYFEDIASYKNDDWTFDAAGNIVTVLTSHFTDVEKFKHLDTLINAGKRVALVYGTDKPVVRITPKGDMLLLLVDSGLNYLNMPISRQRPNLDVVLFYWTADLPELLVKQAHIVGNAVMMPENKHIYDAISTTISKKEQAMASFKQVLDANQHQYTKDDVLKRYLANISNPVDPLFVAKSKYQRAIVPYIYPTTYKKDLFQCFKVNITAGFFTTDQSWVHKLHRGTGISEMVASGVKTLYNAINPEYLNPHGTGFVHYIKSYKFRTGNNTIIDK